uniref:Uncharacterized protein n=1 Tax=Anopheles farauti TaxID=69004 RepID=A0A182QEC5_9DIPT
MMMMVRPSVLQLNFFNLARLRGVVSPSIPGCGRLGVFLSQRQLFQQNFAGFARQKPSNTNVPWAKAPASVGPSCSMRPPVVKAVLLATLVMLANLARAQIDWAEDDDDPASRTNLINRNMHRDANPVKITSNFGPVALRRNQRTVAKSNKS